MCADKLPLISGSRYTELAVRWNGVYARRSSIQSQGKAILGTPQMDFLSYLHGKNQSFVGEDVRTAYFSFMALDRGNNTALAVFNDYECFPVDCICFILFNIISNFKGHWMTKRAKDKISWIWDAADRDVGKFDLKKSVCNVPWTVAFMKESDRSKKVPSLRSYRDRSVRLR